MKTAVIPSEWNDYSYRTVRKYENQSDDGKLRFSGRLFEIETKKLLFKSWEQSIFIVVFNSEIKGEEFSIKKDFYGNEQGAREMFAHQVMRAREKLRNYLVTGNPWNEGITPEEIKLSKELPLEIFKEGGIVRSICNFLNQKIEI